MIACASGVRQSLSELLRPPLPLLQTRGEPKPLLAEGLIEPVEDFGIDRPARLFGLGLISLRRRASGNRSLRFTVSAAALRAISLPCRTT